MLHALKTFFTHHFDAEAHRAYVTLIAQSRRPWFYQELGVADSVDGRFDVMALHMFLLIHRLRRETIHDAGHFIRALSEVFFADMDRSLREMGVGDTGVGRRIQSMAQAFYGRLQAYEQSLAKPEEFAESLKRNLYRDADASEAHLEALAAYARRNVGCLGNQAISEILAGGVSFCD